MCHTGKVMNQQVIVLSQSVISALNVKGHDKRFQEIIGKCARGMESWRGKNQMEVPPNNLASQKARLWPNILD